MEDFKTLQSYIHSFSKATLWRYNYYGLLIENLNKHEDGSVQQAIEVVANMQKWSFTPKHDHYAGLLDLCCRHGRGDAILRMMQTVRHDDRCVLFYDTALSALVTISTSVEKKSVHYLVQLLQMATKDEMLSEKSERLLQEQLDW